MQEKSITGTLQPIGIIVVLCEDSFMFYPFRPSSSFAWRILVGFLSSSFGWCFRWKVSYQKRRVSGRVEPIHLRTFISRGELLLGQGQQFLSIGTEMFDSGLLASLELSSFFLSEEFCSCVCPRAEKAKFLRSHLHQAWSKDGLRTDEGEAQYTVCYAARWLRPTVDSRSFLVSQMPELSPH